MPKVVAKIVHEYAKKMRSPGDVYEVEERHLDILCKLGRVDLAPEPKASAIARDGAGETYRTANIETAPEKKVDPAPKRTRHRASLVGERRP